MSTRSIKKGEKIMFRVHFTDDYGQGSIDKETRYQAVLLKNALEADPKTEDVWIEDLDNPNDL